MWSLIAKINRNAKPEKHNSFFVSHTRDIAVCPERKQTISRKMVINWRYFGDNRVPESV